jgi:3-hydroxybutyryl-CoA dehydrogenase
MEKIAVIGSGTMGNGIAHVFALKGYPVALIDVSAAALEKGVQTISANLDRQLKKEQISEADKNATLDRIKTFQSVPAGVSDADLVLLNRLP